MSKAFSLAATKLGEKGAVTVIGSGNDAADVDKIPMTASVLTHNPYAVAVDASDSSGSSPRSATTAWKRPTWWLRA